MLRDGGSPRGWTNEFVKEKKLEPGEKAYEELYLWIGAYELTGRHDQLNLGGNASLEHVARVIQSVVGALSNSAPVEWPNQKLFVTSLRADDCIVEGNWPVKIRRT